MNIHNKHVYTITLRKAYSFMKSEGVSSADLLKNTEITEQYMADPYHMIGEEQARQYYLNVVHLAGRHGVGLDIGWRTNLSEMGPHGMAGLSARTAGEMLTDHWKMRDNYNTLLDWRYEVKGNSVIHTARSAETDPELRVFLIERGLSMMQVQVEELCGEDAKPIRVLFDYKTPDNVEQYKRIFRCPMRFSQDRIEVVYSIELHNRELYSYDPQAVEVLGALRSNLHQKLSSGGDVVQDVKMALRRTPGHFPALERIAEDMAMSSRTLRRKLGQHDVRFQNLLDDERRRVAEDLLLTTSMPIQQIAEQCGFTDAQNFSQAFKRWLGQSPSEFRQAAK